MLCTKGEGTLQIHDTMSKFPQDSPPLELSHDPNVVIEIQSGNVILLLAAMQLDLRTIYNASSFYSKALHAVQHFLYKCHHKTIHHQGIPWHV